MNKLTKFTLLFSLFSSLQSLADPNFADLDKSIVRIFNQTATGRSTGTGFVINDQHHIVTNHHVIAGTLQLWVADGGLDRTHLKPAQVLFQSEERDLAILSVPHLERPALTLASVEPSKGAQVYAIGFPGAADMLTGQPSTESTVTMGSVSRVIDATWSNHTPTFRVVQHSAEINGGNSGGPLVNTCGQIVGINTVKTSLAASVESGEVIAGVFFASHISSLIDILHAQNLPFTEVNTACTSSVNTTSGSWNFALGLI